MTNRKFKSRWEEIYERLQAEGKVYTFTDEEMLALDEHIRKQMEGFRRDLARKERQSEEDTRRIILNA